MYEEVPLLSVPFRSVLAFSVVLGNHTHIMGTTNLIGLRLFYLQIEHVGYDLESSPRGLSALFTSQILHIFYRFQGISL